MFVYADNAATTKMSQTAQKTMIDAMEREASSDGVANVMALIRQYVRKEK